MLSINTNIFSLTAQAALANNQNPLQTSMERLSTGLRINSASDDAAGLAIATGMQSQINGLNTAVVNANNGVGLLQTAQGALTSITNNLQTIRELAVESANSTNTSDDRTALNTEAQQLIAEIDRVASSTQFNNVNLLDGTFQNSVFQVGANAGQTIEVASIASAKTATLTGTVASYNATVSGYADQFKSSAAITTALQNGQLTINGITIGSSVAGTGAGQTACSAWAIANAINKAGVPGITALAQATVLQSAAHVTKSSAVLANALQVNGFNVGAIASAATAALFVVNVANAINAISAASGITATANTANSTVTLKGADGRDITVTGAEAAHVGLSTAATYGKLTLDSAYGGIRIKTYNTGCAAIGFKTYRASVGFYNNRASTGLAYGDLTINGVTVNPSQAGSAQGQTSDSAWAIANAINNTSGVGVIATANQTTTGELASASTATFKAWTSSAFTINGYNVTAIASAATAVAYAANVVAAVNSISGQTGVTAKEDTVNSRITLSAADGRDIVVGDNGGTTASSVGLGIAKLAAGKTTAYKGSVSLTPTASTGIVIGGNNPSNAGLNVGTLVTGSSVAFSSQSVSQINISTVSGATTALSLLSTALQTVNLSNASLGAYQNRFQSAVSTLQNTSDNLSSAKANIMDADYAVETSNLTKAMIAQQAGISVLAQANTIPQQILALLPKT